MIVYGRLSSLPFISPDTQIEEGRMVVWSEEVDLSADSLYLQVTGKSPDQVFSNLRPAEATHAHQPGAYRLHH